MFRILTFLALITLFITGCAGLFAGGGAGKMVSGSGTVVSETRDVSGFDRVLLQGMGKVVIDQSGTESLRISADDNFLPYIVIEVSGGTLTIKTTERVIFTDVTDLTYYVTAAELGGVELQGAGSMEISDLDTDSWQVKLPGAGSITASGRTVKQQVELSGAGSYDGQDLQSQEAEVVSNGAGKVVVRVSDTLDVTINGIGDVTYIGNPQVTQQINGVGTVSQQ